MHVQETKPGLQGSAKSINNKTHEKNHINNVINQNGNWSRDIRGEYITWLQEDGTVLKAKAVAFSGTEIRLMYTSEDAEIVYTLKTI